MNASELIRRAVATLESSPAIDHWQKDRELIEAEDLLAYVMEGEEPDPDEEIPSAARRRFEALVARRATGEPVPYIKGYAEFRGLHLAVRRGVFVPRDSTEFLVVQALRRLRGRRRPVAVDLATGGGTAALAIANESRRTRVYGTDVSRAAVALARENAKRLALRATFRVGDLFTALPKELAGKVDVITFHPPYVGRREMRSLPAEILRFEPTHTLTDNSPNGLGLVERAAVESGTWLRPGGWLLVEVSPDRSRTVSSLFRRAGFKQVRSTRDPVWDLTRVIVGRR